MESTTQDDGVFCANALLRSKEPNTSAASTNHFILLVLFFVGQEFGKSSSGERTQLGCLGWIQLVARPGSGTSVLHTASLSPVTWGPCGLGLSPHGGLEAVPLLPRVRKQTLPLLLRARPGPGVTPLAPDSLHGSGQPQASPDSVTHLLRREWWLRTSAKEPVAAIFGDSLSHNSVSRDSCSHSDVLSIIH